jgi:CRP-like cAMP-binding protein
MITAQTLMSYSFFASLDKSFVEKIAALGKIVEIDQDEWLFMQDKDAENIYLLTEGKVALAIMFREQIIDTLNPYMKGEIIGWSALVHPHVYTMAAKAETPSTLIAFNGKEMLKVMENNKEEAYNLLRNLTEVISERLINRNIQLMSLRT